MRHIFLLILLIFLFGCIEEIPIDQIDQEEFSTVIDKPNNEIPQDMIAPTIYDYKYIGEIKNSTTEIGIQARTTEPSDCRYSFNDSDYVKLLHPLTPSADGLFHITTVGLQLNANFIYIRCVDKKNNSNNSSVIIDLSKPSSPPAELAGFLAFQSMLNTKCLSCHQPGGSASFWDFTPYKSEKDWTNSELITAGDALNSKMYNRLKGSKGDSKDNTMPIGADISFEEVTKIETWINQLIIDNTTIPKVTFTDANSMINESDNQAIIDIALSVSAKVKTTVEYYIKRATAISSQDYEFISGKVIFEIGQRNKSFSVDIKNDQISENSEAIVFGLKNPEGLEIAGITEHVLTIIDDDQNQDITPPGLSDLLPKNQIVITNHKAQQVISLRTNEPASCKYDTSDQSYTQMSFSLQPNTTSEAHQATIEVEAGSQYTFFVVCVDMSPKANTTKGQIKFSVAPLKILENQQPYNGVIAIIPGRIEAENFDIGAAGEAYFEVDSTPNTTYRSGEPDINLLNTVNGTEYGIGWFEPGEWVEYSVNIQSPGVYKARLNAASNILGNNGGQVSFELDKKNIANFNYNNTGNWQNYQNVEVDNITLSSGLHVLRLKHVSGKFVDINYLEFEKVKDLSPPKIASFNCSEGLEAGKVFMCDVKLDGLGSAVNFNSDCNWLRFGGQYPHYLVLGTPTATSSTCKFSVQVSRTGFASQKVDKDLVFSSISETGSCNIPSNINYNNHIKPLINKNCLSCHGGAQNLNVIKDGVAIDYQKFHDSGNTSSSSNQALWEKTLDSIQWSEAGGNPKMPLALTGDQQYFSKCEVKIVEKWMKDEGTTDGNMTCSPEKIGSFTMSRLSEIEYNNTLRDLMDNPSYQQSVKMPDPIKLSHGEFSNQKNLHQPTTDFFNASWEASKEFAKFYVNNNVNAKNCNDDICAQSIVRSFAIKAFRRNEIENNYYDKLMGSDGPYSIGKELGGVKSGLETAISSILMSPNFLMHYHESSSSVGIDDLSPHELANRLSYLIWQTMPDNSLMAKANDGSLTDPTVLKNEIKRLLADQKSKNFMDTFTVDWLELQSIKQKPEELKLRNETYSGDPNKIVSNSLLETKEFMRYIARNELSINDIINAEYSFLNQEQANFYGVGGANGSNFTQVSLANTNRKGVLTHPSVMAATSGAFVTSTLERGKYLLDKFFCDDPGSPPVNVNPNSSRTEAIVVTKTKSNFRNYLHLLSGNPIVITPEKKIAGDTTCFQCHLRIDPLGASFEKFDIFGKHRETYVDGSAIDTSAFYNNKPINGVESVIEALNNSGKFKSCFTKSIYRYTIARAPNSEGDSCKIKNIASNSQDSIYSIIEEVILSSAFRKTDNSGNSL